MKKYTIIIGPVTERKLGSIVSRIVKFAPLKKVKELESVSTKLNAAPTGIKRAQMTPELIKQMRELRKQGFNAHKIADIVGCGYMSVRRHAPNPESKK